MMNKLFRVVLFVLIVSLLCNTMAFAAKQKEFVVGVSWDEKSIPLIQAWEDYMKAEGEIVGKQKGIKFKWIINVADLDPNRQAANIEDLILQDVDVILARAKDGVAIGASIRAAKEAGIPFVVFDRQSLTEEKGICYVGGDSYNQGKTTAEALAKILKEKGIKGKCIEVMGDLKDNNAVLRSKALNEVAKQTKAFDVVTQVPTEWDPQKYLSGLTNALQAYPDANCIFLASDFAWSAVESALKSSGKWAKRGEPKHIIMATCDLFPDALVAMKAGYIDVTTTWDAYLHAKELVRVLAAIATGEKFKNSPEFWVPGRVVYPETLAKTKNIWSVDYAGWTAKQK